MASASDERTRIQAAYREMPGLRLSVEQASRLFGIDPGPCAVLLRSLADEGVLRPLEGCYYVRAEP